MEEERGMPLRAAALFLAVVWLLVPVSQAQIVDHNHVDAMATAPQWMMDAIGLQKWFFTHASVGSNMLSGLNDLRTADSTRYQLVVSSVGYNSGEQRASNPPATTADGTVYECPRGNPGWSAKYTIFDNSVQVSGWHDDKVHAAMDKLCYIDQNADVSDYLSMMTALESAYPQTVMVYTTMPLMTSEDSNNVLRNQYNDAVRAHCAANNKLLFDIADMEAHDPGGNEHTFQSGGQTYQKLYSGYTSDGGHLDATGRVRIAQGWYAVAATLVLAPLFSHGFEGGSTDGWSDVVP
jgi:hypothetical protein